jgi:hypothetical protein
MRRVLPAVAIAIGLVSVPAASAATPIVERPSVFDNPVFVGGVATPQPLSYADAPTPPRHPFMARNDDSNIHDDAYQTDTADRVGPLGRATERVSTFYGAECASVTFDSRGRIETICVGVQRPTLKLLDPTTLDELASYDLPPRQNAPGTAFTDFSGGGYFYLDDKDRAVVPTSDRHLLVIGQHDGRFAVDRDYDLTGVVPPGDKLIATMPDWKGRIWLISTGGRVVTVDPSSGAVRSRALGEAIGNSFAVDDTGGVYVVTDNALYRLDAARDGTPAVTWRTPYANTGEKKPGQTEHGSGTTPTLMGRDYVSITDNADPMDVVVYKRGRKVKGSRTVCTQPVFGKGASATDNSLIGTARSMVVENNYGYAGPTTTMGGGFTSPSGGTSTPGLSRVDINANGRGCHVVWTSREIAPSVVPKLSLRDGLVYTYTKDPDTRTPADDPFYFTALDFRTGRTVFKRLAGLGLGFNNNYAPVTLGRNGTAYVGVLGGLVALRDAPPPAVPRRPAGPRPRLRLAVAGLRRVRHGSRRRCAPRAVRVRIRGADAGLVVRARFRSRGHRHRDAKAPYTYRLSSHALGRGRRIKAAARLYDGRLRRLAVTVKRCR